ncbi:protein zyg-11 homolog [Neosynchiropus ocellatus]
MERESDGPEALSNLCLTQVCHSLDVLCGKRADGSLAFILAPLFPQEMADRLLRMMAAKGLLNDSTVGIFQNYKELRLRHVSLRSCPVSIAAFQLAICPHRLLELDASCVSGDLTVANIVSSLASNVPCRTSLQRLTINGLPLDWESLEHQVGFSSLQGLRVLNLASTGLTNAPLEDICMLSQLESLDISSSVVSDLTPLLQCKSTLRSLVAHSLHRLDMSPSNLLSVFGQLHALRHLDFSDDHFTPSDGVRGDGDKSVCLLLEGGPQFLPSLVSLDVSGRKSVTEAAVKAFVMSRSEAVFLGLLATGLSSCNILSTFKNLKVAGEANEKQICEALRRYRERECFIREALVHLYNMTVDTDKPQPELLQLVLSAMQSHPTSLHVHLVAAACVFNLTTQNLAAAMPVSLISSAVTQLLHSMKTFPDHPQVQKNCMLALCSDYILQEVRFDKYLASTLVINWLSSHEEQTLQRMAVAVISVLVAKLSPAEIEQLSKDASIMKQLLAIVQQKAMVGVLDSTLKFALSALWNLTDETPTAARNFIESNGLELYEEVLESYHNEASVQQKVLGLLNNVAEVEELQSEMMEEDLIEHILGLLQNPDVDLGVRYFAGGILAHLASRPESWSLDEELHSTTLRQLHASIKTWTHLDREMVSYRSFRPFRPLLLTCQPCGVQFWAVWAIQLVCTQDTSHYSRILLQEGVGELLQSLASHPDTHTDVKEASQNILRMVEYTSDCQSRSS